MQRVAYQLLYTDLAGAKRLKFRQESYEIIRTYQLNRVLLLYLALRSTTLAFDVAFDFQFYRWCDFYGTRLD